ncbi:MAG TPA: hypothetical protein VF258_08415, partial [Luteolibacter sp.]
PEAVQAEAPAPAPAPEPVSPLSRFRSAIAAVPALFNNERPFAEADGIQQEREATSETHAPVDGEPTPIIEAPAAEPEPEVEIATEPEPEKPVAEEPAAESPPELPSETIEPEPLITAEDELAAGFISPAYALGPKKRASITALWGKPKPPEFPSDLTDDEPAAEQPPESALESAAPAPSETEPPKLKLGVKPSSPQSELSLDSAPRGRFEGESPNVFEGEDLDLPPFLRKKK